MDTETFIRKAEGADAIAFRLTTTGPDAHRHKIDFIHLVMDETTELSLPLSEADNLAVLSRILAVPAAKVFYRAQEQLPFLFALGIDPGALFDISLAAQLLYLPGEAHRFDLSSLVARYIGEERLSEASEGIWLLRLHAVLASRLRQHGLERIARIEFDCVRAVAQMEYRGIALDQREWNLLHRRILGEQSEAREKLYAFSGPPLAQTTLWGEEESLDIHFESNAYLLSLLREQGIPVNSTGKRELYPYRHHPLVAALSQYRRTSKQISTYLQPMTQMLHPVTGRLHPHYGQLIAYSGRMSCWNPNIQQIPREASFRACFAAPPGRMLLIADYSQIELRVAAEISQDVRMLAAYRNGEDLHTLTASILTGKAPQQIAAQQRQAAKPVNFGLIFGMGPAGLQESARLIYGIEMTLAQAEDFSRRFFAAYSGIKSWHNRIRNQPPAEGRTLTGRRFAYSGASLPELSNAPVQGTAADIVKRALGLLVDQLEPTNWIVAVIHDEILMECPESSAGSAAALLKKVMEQAANEILPSVPAQVEITIAHTWAGK